MGVSTFSYLYKTDICAVKFDIFRMAAQKLQKLYCFSLIFQFTISLFIQFAFSGTSCPFNEKCDCENSPVQAYSFLTVNCELPTLPVLSPTGTKYLAELLTITSDGISNLPARYFSIFSNIDELMLFTNNPSGISQQWDESAFDDVQIKKITVDGLTGMIPPPPALRRLGSRNLAGFSIGASIGSSTAPVTLLGLRGIPAGRYGTGRKF